MRDIVFHLADGQMRACFEACFERTHFYTTLGCGVFNVDPQTDIYQIAGQTDPGLYANAHKNLELHKSKYNHALIVLDRQWNDSSKTPLDIELYITANMQRAGWARERFEVVVIDPELETWLFQEKDIFLNAFKPFYGAQALRDHLAETGCWPKGQAKPVDPKAAIGAALQFGKSVSRPVLFKNVCSRISVKDCRDTAFIKFKETLQRWFPTAGDTCE